MPSQGITALFIIFLRTNAASLAHVCRQTWNKPAAVHINLQSPAERGQKTTRVFGGGPYSQTLKKKRWFPFNALGFSSFLQQQLLLLLRVVVVVVVSD